MKIGDFRHADCTLFRKPSIDFSSFDATIESMLVDAWKHGYTVEGAIGNILDNKKVIGGLASQIEKEMDFQKNNAMKVVEAAEKESLEECTAEYQKESAIVEETIGAKVTEKKELVVQTQSQYKQHNHEYNAAQKSLEKMREEVKAKLEQVGGVEAYESLISINDALSSKKKKSPKKSDVEKAISEEKIDPLAKKREPVYKEPVKYEEKKPNVIYRMAKKVWSVLNYRF